MHVANAKATINYLLNEKFDQSLMFVESSIRVMQKDSSSCGVFVCLYAKLLASQKDLCPARTSYANFREEIFQSICGNCLKGVAGGKSPCPLCSSSSSAEWVACGRCKQWFHCASVNPSKEEAESMAHFESP